MGLPSVHAEDMWEQALLAENQAVSNNGEFFTSSRIICSGTALYVTKNNHASHSVTNQQCKRVDRFHNSVCILSACLQKVFLKYKATHHPNCGIMTTAKSSCRLCIK